jgi:hypothetical protein
MSAFLLCKSARRVLPGRVRTVEAEADVVQLGLQVFWALDRLEPYLPVGGQLVPVTRVLARTAPVGPRQNVEMMDLSLAVVRRTTGSRSALRRSTNISEARPDGPSGG